MLTTVNDILATAYNKAEINNQGSMRGEGLCSYNVVRKLHNHDEFKSLAQFIETHANTYWQDLNYTAHKQPRVFEMWTNVYKKDAFIDTHSHSPIQIVASFYLQQPDHGGDLAFEHPMMQLMKHQPYDDELIRYHPEFWEYDVPIKTGDLVLFPGYLNHRTRSNNSDQDRIIIGANLCQS
jgi:uncharacterized protein (TIGR02466 family)